jgi:cytochrome c-type biogenesis protein CcmH/NrfF
VRHDALTVTSDSQKQMVTGHVSVFDGGKLIETMKPARWFFARREEEPTTEVAIRRGIGEDLYVVLAGYDAASQSATYAVTVNPLVNWIWFGFAVMAIGTGIALLPERAYAFATAKVPSGAVIAPILLVLLLPHAAFAQHVENPQAALIVPRSPFERELQGEIICMCGTCGRKRIGECTCSMAAEMREEVAGLVRQGKSREEIYQYYIAKYGSQEPLASPIDKGFNRLAWLIPYLAGTTGALAIGFVALRWSRRETPQASTGRDTDLDTDSELNARLNDELRDLD